MHAGDFRGSIDVIKWKCLLFLMLLSGPIAMLRAQKDTIVEYPVSEGCCPNGITNGPDGVWFTAGYGIGSITTSGAQSYYPVSFVPQGAIAAGPDQALWFTGSDGLVGSIGRITTTGDLTQYPTLTTDSFPQAITAGPDGAMWFTESGANNIGRITTAGVLQEYPIPTPYSYPIGIVAGPDGALWFTESAANQIGRITTSGVIQEFIVATIALPTGSQRDRTAPYGLPSRPSPRAGSAASPQPASSRRLFCPRMGPRVRSPRGRMEHCGLPEAYSTLSVVSLRLAWSRSILCHRPAVSPQGFPRIGRGAVAGGKQRRQHRPRHRLRHWGEFKPFERHAYHQL